MKYNFDAVIDRRGSDAIKLVDVPEIWGKDDLLPLWVADMDFATPSYILDAIRKRLDHPIIGYTRKCRNWGTSIVNWQKMRFGWDIKEEWLHFVPGIVPGIACAVNCFTKPGDKVLIQTPVYHPYILVPKNNGREVVESPISIVDDKMEIDFDRFAEDAKGCKMFLLCHPHNPGGRVWTKAELQKMAEICAKENILVVSDEIHADLTLPPYKHIPFAEVSEQASQISITLASPSKAFNMAGLTSSYSIIPNDEIRECFHNFLESNDLSLGHTFAFLSVVAAYSNGTEWLDQCLENIQCNIGYVVEILRKEMPRIRMIRPQASFLIFLDCTELNLSHDELNSFFVDKAHLALNDGEMFGTGGEGFMRMNIAAPRSVIEKAMQQLKEAYQCL